MTWISVALIGWAAAIAAADLRSRRIPNAALLAVLLLVLGSFALRSTGPLGVAGPASLIGALIPLLLLPSHAAGWLGAGDIKLASTMGLVLGPVPLMLALLMAAALLGAASLPRIAARRHAPIPAAPMLASGFVAVLSLAAIA
jgi:prepilin peptidase CpaA